MRQRIPQLLNLEIARNVHCRGAVCWDLRFVRVNTSKASHLGQALDALEADAAARDVQEPEARPSLTTGLHLAQLLLQELRKKSAALWTNEVSTQVELLQRLVVPETCTEIGHAILINARMPQIQDLKACVFGQDGSKDPCIGVPSSSASIGWSMKAQVQQGLAVGQEVTQRQQATLERN